MRFGLKMLSLPAALLVADPAAAGMTQDLANCTKSENLSSAEACTRVISSGRLKSSDQFIAYFNRGWGYRNAGEDAKALADFDRAIKHSPKHPDSYYSRALAHYDLGDSDKSQSDLARYLELKPDNWMAYYQSAQLHRQANDTSAALADLDKAAELSPGEQRVSVMRALVLSDSGTHAEARELIDAALITTPKDGLTHYVRAVIDRRDGNIDAALSHLERAVEFQQPFPAAHVLRGEIAEDRGETAEAERHYREALDSVPKGFSGKWAQDTARTRLKEIGVDVVDVKEPDPAREVVASGSKTATCRKYFAATGAIMEVACE